MSIPVIVGNCVTYDVTLDLMEAGADAVLVGVGPGRRLHDARSAGHRRPAGDGHGRRGRGARPLLQAHREVRARHHRRRHGHRRRRLQGVRVRARRRHDRVGDGAREGGAGPRIPLGHGDAARRPARGARGSRPGTSGTLEGDPGRPRAHGRRHAEPRSARSRPAWAPSAPRTSSRCSRPSSSSPRRSGPRAS